MKIKPKDAAFWALLVTGIGLTIGGIFLAPLSIAGAACLSGAIALAKDTPTEGTQSNPEHQPHQNDDNQLSLSDENLDVNVQVDVARHRHRHRHLSFAQANHPIDPESKSDGEPDTEHKKSKFHKRP